MKRNLKADLEAIRNFRSKWRQSTSVGEAWDIGVAWEYFCREKAELWLDQALAEKERADKYEALAWELVETLEIFDTVNIDASLKERIEDAKKARAVLVKAKEVLGND